jgi:hypothetical protein
MFTPDLPSYMVADSPWTAYDIKPYPVLGPRLTISVSDLLRDVTQIILKRRRLL